MNHCGPNVIRTWVSTLILPLIQDVMWCDGMDMGIGRWLVGLWLFFACSCARVYYCIRNYIINNIHADWMKAINLNGIVMKKMPVARNDQSTHQTPYSKNAKNTLPMPTMNANIYNTITTNNEKNINNLKWWYVALKKEEEEQKEVKEEQEEEEEIHLQLNRSSTIITMCSALFSKYFKHWHVWLKYSAN